MKTMYIQPITEEALLEGSAILQAVSPAGVTPENIGTVKDPIENPEII